MPPRHGPISAWPNPAFVACSVPLLAVMLLVLQVLSSGSAPKAFWDENGPVETAELILLASASALSLVAYVRLNDEALVAIAFAMFAVTLAFAVRETVSCEGLAARSMSGICVPRAINRAVTAIAVVALAARALYVVARQRHVLAALLRPRLFWPALPPALCLLAAEGFETLGRTRLEEGLELAAYCVILVLAVQLLVIAGRQQALEGDRETG